jgi:hypothetical protein
LGREAHALSEQLVVWDFIARKGNKKKFILNTIVKEQGLEFPHQEAFFTETPQVK